jgi:hypothetical protein
MNEQLIDSISEVVQSLVKAYENKVNAELLQKLAQAYEDSLCEEARCKRMKQRELVLEMFGLDQAITKLKYSYNMIKSQYGTIPEIEQEIDSLQKLRSKIASEKNSIGRRKEKR